MLAGTKPQMFSRVNATDSSIAVTSRRIDQARGAKEELQDPACCRNLRNALLQVQFACGPTTSQGFRDRLAATLRAAGRDVDPGWKDSVGRAAHMTNLDREVWIGSLPALDVAFERCACGACRHLPLRGNRYPDRPWANGCRKGRQPGTQC